MRARSAIWLLTAIAAVAGLSFAGWKIYHDRESHECAACQRPIHGNTLTVAESAGKRSSFCCPACALSQHLQTRSPVRVVRLTDYNAGDALTPASAYLVRGSDVNSCAHHGAGAGPDKHAMHTHYDRCSPSLIAFGGKESAAAFVRGHGGQVVTFAEVAAAFE